MAEFWRRTGHPGRTRNAFMRRFRIRRGLFGYPDFDRGAVRIAEPAFPVVGTAVTLRRIAVPWKNDFSVHFDGTGDGRVEIV